MDGLTEGRIVHYVLPDGFRGVGNHRPAIVVNVWRDVSGVCEGYVNLQVFVDGTNDLGLSGVNSLGDEISVMWRTSICYSEEPKPNTWHWIEKA